MRTRLTERDLSRIVRRVINEQDTVDNEYCDINFYSKQLKSNYDDIQGIIDKLVSAENATYDCDAHKYYIRQMLVGELYESVKDQVLSGPYTQRKNLINFLMNRYDFLK
jgi:hypothetical protein